MFGCEVLLLVRSSFQLLITAIHELHSSAFMFVWFLCLVPRVPSILSFKLMAFLIAWVFKKSGWFNADQMVNCCSRLVLAFPRDSSKRWYCYQSILTYVRNEIRWICLYLNCFIGYVNSNEPSTSQPQWNQLFSVNMKPPLSSPDLNSTSAMIFVLFYIPWIDLLPMISSSFYHHLMDFYLSIVQPDCATIPRNPCPRSIASSPFPPHY